MVVNRMGTKGEEDVEIASGLGETSSGDAVSAEPSGRRAMSPAPSPTGPTDADATPPSDPFHSLLPEIRHRHELSAMHAIGRLIAEQLDVAGVLAVAVRHLSEAVGGANAFVMLLEGRSLRVAATTVGDPVGHGLTLSLDEPSIAATATLTNAPVLIHDSASDARVSSPLARHFGHRALLAVPLRARGETVGCIVLGQSSSDGRFDEEDIIHTMAIGNQVAIAIANARLIEDLKGSYAKLERAQQALVEKERLAALGELSAVIAHEVRNPLAILWNSIGALRRLLQPKGQVASLLEIMTEESERLNRMVSDLLDYARPHTPEKRAESFGAIAREAVAAAMASHGARSVKVDVVEEADLPKVSADARLLRQAILNLVANALQAAPEGGTVTVNLHLEPTGFVRFDVSDQGPGLSTIATERLFQPFFTTKPTGTGLGLALVKRIVEAHQGEISVRSAPNAGATFSVRLPRAQPSDEG
jgi:two-component system sensor histidine kinase HydH